MNDYDYEYYIIVISKDYEIIFERGQLLLKSIRIKLSWYRESQTDEQLEGKK